MLRIVIASLFLAMFSFSSTAEAQQSHSESHAGAGSTVTCQGYTEWGGHSVRAVVTMEAAVYGGDTRYFSDDSGYRNDAASAYVQQTFSPWIGQITCYVDYYADGNYSFGFVLGPIYWPPDMMAAGESTPVRSDTTLNGISPFATPVTKRSTR